MHYWRMGVTVQTWPGGETPAPSDATILLDIGVAVVPQLHVVMMDDDDDYYVRAVLIYSLSEACYIPREVTVGMRSLVSEEDFKTALDGTRLKAEPPVSSVALRQVKVAELVRSGAANGVFLRFKGIEQPFSLNKAWGEVDGSELMAEGVYAGLMFYDTPREDLLRHIALVYMVAVMAGESPAQAVERAFGLAKRTAANWISRAKAEGYIRIPKLANRDG